MAKTKTRCRYCGKVFSFFDKKFSGTIYENNTLVTFFVCEKCYERYLASKKQQ